MNDNGIIAFIEESYMGFQMVNAYFVYTGRIWAPVSLIRYRHSHEEEVNVNTRAAGGANMSTSLVQ